MKTLMIAAVLLAGCAAEKPWVKATTGGDDFKSAKSECTAKAFAASPPDGSITSYLAMKQGERACLMEKGWREPT